MELLITTKEVFELSFSGEENMKEDRIPDAVIRSAQEKYIRPVLGDLLDNLMKPEYEEFLNDYIKPPLAFYVRHLILPDISIHLSNMGAFLPENDFSKVATDRQRDTLRQSAIQIADPLMDLAVRYIKEHISDFPSFRLKTKKKENIIGGIIF